MEKFIEYTTNIYLFSQTPAGMFTLQVFGVFLFSELVFRETAFRAGKVLKWEMPVRILFADIIGYISNVGVGVLTAIIFDRDAKQASYLITYALILHFVYLYVKSGKLKGINFKSPLIKLLSLLTKK